ncbi:MAG: glucose-6-phosphate isomerase, partial [Flavobacterium macrobrachii]
MTLPNTNPTATAVWEKLNQHYQNIKNVSMQEMFRNDTSRAEKFHIQWNDFLIDYSKNRISSETMELLQQLA